MTTSRQQLEALNREFRDREVEERPDARGALDLARRALVLAQSALDERQAPAPEGGPRPQVPRVRGPKAKQ